VSPLNPLDLVKAAPWNSVLFTTYALSLSFFEAVVVDALVRGGAKNPVILSDPEGVRAGLSELGARLVGRDYELLPVQRSGGVFHPKVTAFVSDDDAHLLVGSGNLTFGGWGGNFELIEHLHPSFASDAINDAAEFLDLLQIDERLKLPDTEWLVRTAEGLRRSVRGLPATGRTRLIHNAGNTIAERLRLEAEELGGAVRICFASAFYDETGQGVTKLVELLGCNDVSAYVHQAGSVRGHAGCNWPNLSERILAPVTIEKEFVDDKRLLHAKAIEILCRNGRLTLSGSVNATSAALFGGNMEAGVLRIEPDRQGAWSLSGCSAPVRLANADDEDSEEEKRNRVLAAELVGTSIKGVVLTNWRSGPAKMTCEVEGDLVDLGDVNVDGKGAFIAPAGELADRIWSRGRVVIRLNDGDIIAEGFLTITAVAELVRRAGQVASRILSVLTGTETPEDVAAIMSWFHEDPSRMPQAVFKAEGAGKDKQAPVDQIVTAGMLGQAHFTAQDAQGSFERSAAWQSAMSALLTAFRSNRGPFRSEAQAMTDTGEDLSETQTIDETRDEKANERAVDSFSKLLEAALKEENEGRYAETMMGLAQYLVDRIRPPDERVTLWIEKIMRSLPSKVEGNLALDVLALQLLRVANSPTDETTLRARRLLRKNSLLSGLEEADPHRLPAFQAYLPSAIDLDVAREKLAKARTHREEIQILLDTPVDEALPSLPLLEASEHWSDLKRIHKDERLRERLEFVDEPVKSCPKCHMGLPTGNSGELRQYGLTRCTNRCGRLIISLEA